MTWPTSVQAYILHGTSYSFLHFVMLKSLYFFFCVTFFVEKVHLFNFRKMKAYVTIFSSPATRAARIDLVCARFWCVWKMLWLPVLWNCNVPTGLNTHDGTQGMYARCRKRACTESWLWERKIPCCTLESNLFQVYARLDSPSEQHPSAPSSPPHPHPPTHPEVCRERAALYPSHLPC